MKYDFYFHSEVLVELPLAFPRTESSNQLAWHWISCKACYLEISRFLAWLLLSTIRKDFLYLPFLLSKFQFHFCKWNRKKKTLQWCDKLFGQYFFNWGISILLLSVFYFLSQLSLILKACDTYTGAEAGCPLSSRLSGRVGLQRWWVLGVEQSLALERPWPHICCQATYSLTHSFTIWNSEISYSAYSTGFVAN